MKKFYLHKSIQLSNVFFKLASKSNKKILKKIESFETFKDRIDFAEKNFKHTSSGSSRIIYDLGNGKALKLASNEKGLAQNKAEWSVKDNSKYINKVTSKGKDYIWIIAPLAEKITEKTFQDLTGILFKDFGECIKYKIGDVKKESSKKLVKPDSFDNVKEKDIFKEIVEIASKHDLLPGDIARISSWKCIDNVPVLVDLGLSSDIHDKYYK